MKKPSVKFTVILGVIVVLLLAGASWYSIMFNDWRLVARMDFEDCVLNGCHALYAAVRPVSKCAMRTSLFCLKCQKLP